MGLMCFALIVVSLFYLANAFIASSHLDYHITIFPGPQVALFPEKM